MATTKRESALGKERRGSSPSKSSIAHGHRRSSPGSTQKQVPNYLKPTLSSRSDAIKNVKKPGPEDTSQRPDLLRRRSFDRPPSAARVHKALISPGRDKPTTSRSVSFASKSTTSPKATLERVLKKPNAGKPQTLSSSRSMNKTTGSTTKKGSTSSASKKTPSSHDKKEVQNLETKHENEETLDHQVEEVVKDYPGEIDYFEIPKAEENEHPDVVSTTEVNSVEEGKVTHDDISTVSQEHNVPQTEEMEDKVHEEKSDHTQHDEYKENDSKEEISVDHYHQEEIPHEEAKPETEDEAEDNETDEVTATKEIGEEKQLESREENGEESQQGLELCKEETIEEEVEESKPEAENVVAKSEVQAENRKKESPTPYNDVIEETASKLLEERKNKVRALVGAFETVIDKETSNAK
ncbi:claspin-like [Durio zibethinus]|uniref:Claspin-like n=1 Tax=Durio zibethinus TaxID=66656 RepID=A0A6P5ZHJ5_DURZI|nr:claspin-like [Durio zibethinus]